ncbi:acetyl-CoA carboxylase biotin carboxyl carrier protein [Helicobacter mustelae]|uniref:Biotin carboxyl carrier protein of acetyl-CoA carboxylase n=1 Tax=Helicobacter mustelae (strain ATCC 43772 / CCUG 25715 / CIP 103759 / LMG 18044 / NCTC 12198 / R85-136P) TaxID=679897 RepID=D3UG75_HELM1|nr:acetyl-CoA carboxylase biotin carboxyl carrier protein [Helicobacter mustelae]CBG39496.1 putative biotin carboxyl carrier protein of acetyl-CoA carboxylase [Helicobacter mustelae 12198]SQH71008.1 biotin carboxyl carrier protein of acetyl-CoA carboxylase [Helicobacter mustelae]STP12137.1 biotin carboxyl carrier protein of acetyl-CoA carboxylase [Helicobacter mustelae]
MNLKEIKEIVEIFNESSITKLQIKREGFEIRLDKISSTPTLLTHTPAPIHAPQLPATPDISDDLPSCSVGGDFITSPMVGTFYRAPSPGADPFVKVGDTVRKGQIIGIVEAMKIMNEIEAEYDCKILNIEANDGQPVEFDSKLVKIEKLQ